MAINFNRNEYLKSKSFFGFLLSKIRSGEPWRVIASIFRGIRKYTLVSTIIKGVGIAVALLEKSAVLLLLFTCIILILPLIFIGVFLYYIACFFKHLSIKSGIRKWLVTEQPITVFIASEHVFSASPDKMFLRAAKQQAATLTGPVILVCSDAILCAKWYALNLLAIRTDYFFILRRNFIEKNSLKVTYIVL
jgi:hypothetical protein